MEKICSLHHFIKFIINTINLLFIRENRALYEQRVREQAARMRPV